MPVQKRKQGNSTGSSQNAKNNTPHTISDTQRRWKQLFGNIIGYNTSGLPMGVGMGAAFGKNPFISNARIKNLQSRPWMDERSGIEQALLDPNNHELDLRMNTHSIINQTYPLYRLLYLYEGILSYNNYVYPMYVEEKQMNTPRFKSDTKFTDMWVKELKPEKTFRRIVAQVLMEGKKPYVLRQKYNTTTNNESVDYVLLEDIPSDWFKITDITNDSYYGISFDFFYFTTPGTDIRQFPPFFKDIYMELMGYGKEGFDGTIEIDPDKVAGSERITAEYDSTLNTWAYWSELPADVVWTFCFTEADPLAVSPFVSLLLMGSDLANYNLLQQQLVSAPLNSLILGELETVADASHSGFGEDQYTISGDALTAFEAGINSVLSNANIAYKMTPSTKNTMFNVPSVPNGQNVYNEAMRGLVNTAGTGALQTLSERPTVAQTNMAKITEYRFIDRMYSQFEHFVNTIFKRMYNDGDLKHRWGFKIFGNSFTDADEADKLEKALSMGQMEFLPRYLAIRDMSMTDAVTVCDYVNSTGIYDKFKPLVSSYTMQSDTINENRETKSLTGTKQVPDEGGRPPIDNPENDNTDASKNQGASDARNE